MAVEANHAEVCKTIEAGFAQLKMWLDIRLQHQDELLGCICNCCNMLCETAGCLPPHPNVHVAATASLPEALRTTALCKPDDCRTEKASVDVASLPGLVDEDSKLHTYTQSHSSFSEPELVGSLHPESLPSTNVSFKGLDWQSALMDIFDQLDVELSGSIALSELKDALAEAEIPEVAALQVFKADSTGDGLIDRVEWLQLIEDASRGSHDDIKQTIDFLHRVRELQKARGSLSKMHLQEKPFLILRHDSPWRMAWDVLLCILLFYVSISVPFTLGFKGSNFLKGVDLCTDVFFCCDIVLNFRTSFMDDEGSTVVNGKMIAMKYLNSWFLLDFISSVPFDLITDGFVPNLTPVRLAKIGKVAKVLKLLRISKTLGSLSESELMEAVDHFITSRYYQKYTRLLKLVLVMFVAAHWLACFGSAIDRSSIDAYFADTIETPSELKRYLAGMYWSMTTLSTVGYGDITPKTDEERLYAIIAMVIGGALYGYVIGSVTSVVTTMDVKTHAYHERMELVYSWLDSQRYVIPRSFRRRLRHYFKRTLAAKAVMDDTSVVSELSPELRADIASFLVHKHVKLHPMFEDNPNSTLATLVEVLRKNSVNKGERVVRIGEPGTAMYILVEGLGRFEQGTRWLPEDMQDLYESKKFEHVTQGDSFGEEIIFHLAETYSYTIMALKPSDFDSIGEDDFKDKYKNMPEFKRIMLQAFLRSARARARNGYDRVSVSRVSRLVTIE